mgnify:CR=1 FL=1
MNLFRISFVFIFALSLLSPLYQSEDSVYRVDGLPENLYYETGKVYQIDLAANTYSEISSVNITVSNGTLSPSEEITPEIHNLILEASDSGWTFYWEAPSESYPLGEGEAELAIIFNQDDGSVWASFDSVLRPPEIVAHSEPSVPQWALSLAWGGVSVTVILTIIGAFVLRRDHLT